MEIATFRSGNVLRLRLGRRGRGEDEVCRYSPEID